MPRRYRPLPDWQWPKKPSTQLKRRAPVRRERRLNLPPLSVPQILAWADAHHARTGKWPNHQSGQVPEAPEVTWSAIHANLCYGNRGLPGGFTLKQLLVKKRGLRNNTRLPELGLYKILNWADAHLARHGTWPNRESGVIPESGGETWATVNAALRFGLRGFEGGSSLSKVLNEWRRKYQLPGLRKLSVSQILEWADEYFAAHGRWPGVQSGGIPKSRGDSWRKVNMALHRGARGLPGGTSLARLLKANGRGDGSTGRSGSSFPLRGNSGYDQNWGTTGSINPTGAQ